MMQLNAVGESLSHLPEVHAMTDVTGFGLAGHLLELCEASEVAASIREQQIPLLDAEAVYTYIDQGCIPGGTHRNFKSYGDKISELSDIQKAILCDPQTSGGLLIAVDPKGQAKVELILGKSGVYSKLIGECISSIAGSPLIRLV